MPVKKFLALLFLFTLIMLPLVINVHRAAADQLDDVNKQLSQLNDELTKSVAATKPLQSQLDNEQKQLASIKYQIGSIESDIALKKKQIDSGYANLAQKETIISQTIRDFYVKSYYANPLLTLFSEASMSDMTQTLAYQHAQTEQDKSIITNIALTINDLQIKKTQLQQEETALATAKVSLDAETAKLNKVVSDAQAYQSQVSIQISQLSAQQQQIIQAKGSGFTTALGDSDLADDYNASSKGFRESAPAGSFAIFSYGAYTHRKGMSQYGAMGRAERGQDYHAILKAYYGKDTSTADTGGTIQVAGAGAIDFETTYLYGIAEMPSSFPTEALKAQAIAARSYAYRYKQGNQEICTDEGCQVYSASKAANPPAEWKAAVDATKGQIIDGVTAYFSSTAGGYLTTSGWDTTDAQGGANFADNAYEKIAGSPWFYKAWYRKGYSNSGDTCGRSSAWLSPTEMADIVNAYLVMTKGGSDEKSRVTPVTTSCWGGNPYSMDELRNVANKYGGISSANSVSVTQGGDGNTANVAINGISMNGKDFRDAVYLRAPGYIRIPQGAPFGGYAFFNIEKK
ncbi:MAG: SpoIID/LytB domain-containing protein [Candidatus Levyibacteriota bacterium]